MITFSNMLRFRGTSVLQAYQSKPTCSLPAINARYGNGLHVHFVSAVQVGDRRTGFRQRNIDVIIAMREVSHRCNADVRGTFVLQEFHAQSG